MPDDVKPVPILTDEQIRAAVEQGRKSAREGNLVLHEEVKKWAESLGTDAPRPLPRCK